MCPAPPPLTEIAAVRTKTPKTASAGKLRPQTSSPCQPWHLKVCRGWKFRVWGDRPGIRAVDNCF